MNADLLARNIVAHWVQSGLVVMAVLIAIRLFKRSDPRLELAALHGALAATLLLPLIQPWRPLEVPTLFVEVNVAGSPGTRFLATTAEPPALSRFDAATAALIVMLIGFALRLIWLSGGIVRLRRLRSRSREIPVPEVAGELEAMLGVTVRYFEHGKRSGPATFGIFNPTVMLPSTFASLDLPTQRAIVSHELLHVKRRDAAAAAFEELLVSLLWFHPWVWAVRSRIGVAREQIVDRQVVELIGNRDAYVRCLIAISGHDLVPHMSTGMAGARELRSRIDAVLQETSMSRSRAVAVGLVVTGVIAAVGSMAAWAVPLRDASADTIPGSSTAAIASMFSRAPAAGPGFGTPPVGVSSLVANTKFFTTLVSTPDSRPGQGPQTVAVRAFGQTASSAPRKPINMPYAEYPQDAIERRISGTVVVDIVVNRAGEVSTAAVVGGPQELRSSAFKAALGLKFEAGSATTALRVGIEYRLTADSWGVRVSVFDAGTPSPDGQMRQAIETLPRTTPLEGVRIGVAVMPPKKIRDVPPIYPSAAQEARVQGVVILEARIDESGNVGDTRILRSIPLLDQAATNAVRQWQYTPTLLNGAAVPVVMTVTVNFTLRTQVHLRVTMPDGTLTLLRTSPNGGIARTEYAPMSKYGFAPFVDSNRSVDTVTVVIYELGDPGTAPTSLGTIELKPGAGPVQTNTTPSFGIEVMSVER